MIVLFGGNASNRAKGEALPSIKFNDDWYKARQIRLNTDSSTVSDAIYFSFKCPSIQLNETIEIEFCCPEYYNNVGDYPRNVMYNSESEYTIYDTSGFGNNASLSTDPSKTTYPAYRLDTAIGNYSLQNPNDRNGTMFLIPNNGSSLYQSCLQDEYTLSCWIKLSENSRSGEILSFGCGDGADCYCSVIEDSGGSRLKICTFDDISTSNKWMTSSTVLQPNKWYHVAFVRPAYLMRVYINGVRDKEYEEGESEAYAQGMHYETVFNQLPNAFLSDFELYSTALSSEDIKELYSTKCSIQKNNILYTKSITETTKTDRYNLIYNGMHELKSKTGFELYGGNYSTESTRGGNGSLYLSQGAFQYTYGMIPVNPNDTYRLEFDIKWTNITDYKYFSIIPYDVNGNKITPYYVNHYEGTETTLAEDLLSGASTLKLTSGSSWQPTSATYWWQKLCGICDLSYATNYERCRTTLQYSALSGNVLTLTNSYSGKTIPAGTKVANFYDGATYYYPYTFTTSNAPKTWKHFSFDIKASDIRPFTKYVRLAMVSQKEGDACYLANLSFKNISNLQLPESTYGSDTVSINRKSNLCIQELREVGAKIRYIRDCCGKNTKNNSSHWTEIQAYDVANNNVALGKPIIKSSFPQDGNKSLSIITNDVISSDSTQWIGASNAPSQPNQYHSVIVDLGKPYLINNIKVWHYWADTRTYSNTKTEVSLDGATWYTMFDSNVDGEYLETASGHIVLVKPFNTSFAKSGKVFVDEISEI